MRDGFVLTALTLQLLVTPATAQTQSLEQPECNSSNISSLSEKIERMKESANKSTAETEIGIAKDMKPRNSPCLHHRAGAARATGRCGSMNRTPGSIRISMRTNGPYSNGSIRPCPCSC